MGKSVVGQLPASMKLILCVCGPVMLVTGFRTSTLVSTRGRPGFNEPLFFLSCFGIFRCFVLPACVPLGGIMLSSR